MSTAAPLNKAETYKFNLTLARTGVYLLLAFLTIVCVLPLWIMVVNATRTNNEIFAGVTLIPGDQMIINFQTLIDGKIIDPVLGTRKDGLNIPQGFLNSFIIASLATFLTGYFSALTAYGFALYTFRGKKLFWGIIMTVIMLPPTVGLIGYYKLVAGMGLLDNYIPLIIPAIASPFAVFFLRQYLSSSLPLSLIEAARIDGAKELAIFHRVALPIIMPGIATISILGFLGNWNSYLNPLIVLSEKTLLTLPLLIQQLNTSLYNRDFGAMYMGITLSVVPILIMFSVFSKYLIEGITAGGVKE